MSSEGTQVLGTAMLWHLFNAISIKCLFYSTHESFCTSMSTTSSIQWKMSEIFCLKKKKNSPDPMNLIKWRPKSEHFEWVVHAHIWHFCSIAFSYYMWSDICPKWRSPDFYKAQGKVY